MRPKLTRFSAPYAIRGYQREFARRDAEETIMIAYGMDIIRTAIARKTLRDIAAGQFGDFVKAVVDVERELMAIGADMHADEEAALLDNGSLRSDLWGINLYPDLKDDQWVEFDSMINVRPSQGNRSRDVENTAVREKILAIVRRLVQE